MTTQRNWLFLEARSADKLREQLAALTVGWSRLSGPSVDNNKHWIWVEADRPVEKKKRRNIKKPTVIVEATKEL